MVGKSSIIDFPISETVVKLAKSRIFFDKISADCS